MSPLRPHKDTARRPRSPNNKNENSSRDTSLGNSPEMSSIEFVTTPNSQIGSSRTMPMAIPEPLHTQGAYCPRRPSLDEILSNQSHPPWTLSAFMAYLSHNHCLETLEFTMDAKRYKQHYEKTAAKLPNKTIPPASEQSAHLGSLWSRLMQAYIQPNGVREVNLPSSVRDALLAQDISRIPPHPSMLDIAVQKVHELMEESVLVPFLNSVWPPSQPDSNSSSVEDLSMPGSYDERGQRKSRIGRKIKQKGSPLSASPPAMVGSPQLGSGSPPVQSPLLSHTAHHRASAPSAISQFARSLSTRHGSGIPHSNPPSFSPAPGALHAPASTHLSTANSAPAAMAELRPRTSAEGPSMTEDSMSATSAGGEPMTPPTTPPASDQHSPLPHQAAFARSGNPWKRMRYSFGWGKKRDSDTNMHNFHHG